MNLPSIRALNALALIAETGSVSGAADRMGVTHSAVSHMIRTLEQTIGTELTRRDGRGITLTSQGHQYASRITPALAQIAEAGSSFLAAKGVLRVDIAGGFSANWLMPRLGSFRTLFPDVELELSTPRAYGDLGRLNKDLYITFARASDVPDRAQHLMDIAFFPLCAPALLPELASPKNLLSQNLLHLTTRDDWSKWLALADAETSATGGVLFDEMQIMLAAAIAGQGLCLGDRITGSEALKRGRLYRPFSQALESDRAYWLVTGPSDPTPAATAFADWLLAELSL